MKIFSRALLDDLATKASASPRKRAHYNIHASASDPVQRFFVAADKGTYFRPHRHLTKVELALVLRGRFEVVTFDDTGRLESRQSVGEDSPALAYETALGTWHTLLAHTDGGAFLEVKEGPYDPATIVEFASWAPQEGDPAVPRFMKWIADAKPGDRFT
jgi:cupin fold WbuC family metalloprotein